jgi:hypothetical protein
MRTIVLVASLIALAPPSHAAQTGAKARYTASECRNLVGREVREGTGEYSHVGRSKCNASASACRDDVDLESAPLPTALVDRRKPGIVRHHGRHRQALAYLYFEDEAGRRMTMKRLTKDEARRIAVNIVRLPELLRPILAHSHPSCWNEKMSRLSNRCAFPQ